MNAALNPPSTGDVFTRHLRSLIDVLSGGLVERDEAIRVALLATLAGENVLLLGPPGTAKSLIARRLAAAFKDKPFQYLLTKFTTPDELFGPVSLRELKENDAFRRKIEGYLPAARVAFLDEIFKASSAILNALLTLINERIFFNGSEVVKVPLLALVAASNEIPAESSLLALFDRFSVRLLVSPIASQEAFLSMLKAPAKEDSPVQPGLALDEKDVLALRAACRDVHLPPRIQKLIARVKAEVEKLATEGAAAGDADDEASRGEGDVLGALRFYVSDRRWQQAVRLLRMSAYAHGRSEVDEIDCALLQHCLWNHQADADLIRAILDRCFEDLDISFGLHLDELVRGWWGLLKDMRGQPGVAQPLDNRLTVMAGRRRIMVAERELEDWKKGDHALIFKHRIAWDASAGQLRPIEHNNAGAIHLVRSGYGYEEWVTSAQSLRDYLGRGYEFRYESKTPPATIQGSSGVGMRLRFEEIHAAVHRHWLEEVRRLEMVLEEQRQAREAAHRTLEARKAEHLFVDPAQLKSLGMALARAALILEQWQKKLADLKGALEARGQASTTDLSLAGGEPAEGWRQLLAPANPRAQEPEEEAA